MSIALSAILLVLLLVPGFLFRDRYRRSFRADTRGVSLFFADASAQTWGRPSREFLHIVVAAALLDVAFWAAATLASRVTAGAIPAPDLASALLVLLHSFGPGERHLERVLASVVDRPGWILLFFAVLYALAAAAGTLCCWAVRRLELDRRWNLLEFANPWVRLLVGDTRAVEDKLADLDPAERARVIVLTSVSVAVDLGGATHLYFGFLESMHLDTKGDIDHVVLWLTHRRPMKADKTPDASDPEAQRYYPIRGDYVAVKYSEIRNLNVDYVLVFEDEGDADPEPEPRPWPVPSRRGDDPGSDPSRAG